MNCYNVKDKLETYLDSALQLEDTQGIADHLKHCPNCTEELQSLRKVDALLKIELFDEPPSDYWAELPGTITDRIGLQPKTSRIQEIVSLIDGFLFSPAAKWGMGFAVAAFLIFFLTQTRFEETTNTLSQEEMPAAIRKTSKKQNGIDDVSGQIVQAPTTSDLEKTPEFDLPQQQSIEKSPETRITTVAGTPVVLTRNDNIAADIILEPVKQVDLLEGIGARLRLAKVEKLAAKQHLKVDQEYAREIYPLVGHLALMSSTGNEALDDDDEDESGLQTFTFTSGLNPLVSRRNGKAKVEKRDSLSPSDDAEAGSFSTTLSFVEESKKLSEKRNIWLSYVNRENNVTYRSLGVYQLADVYYRIAEKKEDPDDVEDAIKFYYQYEKTLKSMMGVEAFQFKLAFISALVTKN